MPEKVCPGPVHNSSCIKEAVCVHTKKVFDSCRDKECLQDLKVSLTRCSQEILDKAMNVKPKKVELVWVYIDVESVPFNKGFYTVDVRYFYKVTCDAFCGVGRPYEITGLATYDKRVILYGSEGSVRIFSSTYVPGNNDIQQWERTNMPKAIVEVVDPIALSVKVTDKECACGCSCDCRELPDAICACFDDELLPECEGKHLYVTLGQFSIIRLERDTQLLIPAYDFCIPEKECSSSSEDPCEVFEKFSFPLDEFFPPETRSFSNQCGCTPCDKK